MTASAEFLAPPYAENVARLAVGLEVIDYCRGTRVGRPLRVSIEGQRPVRGFRRHDSCLFALVLEPGLRTPIDVLISDDARRYVPRRVRLPMPAEAAVRSGDPPVNPVPAARRAWRPVLFPGAAYDIGASATGLRGRVVAEGKPLPWARVVATLQGSGEVVGRGSGDDRGEFLLPVLDPRHLDELPLHLPIRVRVTGPEPLPVRPARTAESGAVDDHLWALPLEHAGPAGQRDAVLDGVALPTTYEPGRVAVRNFALELGRVTSDRVPYDVT